MLFSNFVHLHLHSHYSFQDSTNSLKSLLAQVKQFKMPAVALTDHGNMHGLVEFFQLSLKAGVKPILGCEVYVSPTSRLDKQGGRKDSAYHLVLLCKNLKGYENLIRLVSISNLEGFYYVPRVDDELLASYSQGLLVLSSCIAGQIPQLILQNKQDAALDLIFKYQDIFGKDDFYLELQRHHLQKEDEYNKVLLEFSKKYKIPVVASNDCHFNAREDFFAHEVLTCLQMNTTINNPNRFKMYNEEYYIKSPEEMSRLFSDCPEAIKNTIAIMDRCNVKLPLGVLNLPVFKSEDKGDMDSGEYLEKICRENIPTRYQNWNPELEKRFNYELQVILQKGYADYFLITWDVIKFARDHGIPVGPGRGSAAGSILSYLLYITNIDPIPSTLESGIPKAAFR
ncbi:DNA polymerase III subunit alpha [Candidatus Riflebacteria bacterium]